MTMLRGSSPPGSLHKAKNCQVFSVDHADAGTSRHGCSGKVPLFASPLSSMPPILHLMRHGQGYHALSNDGHNIRDPELTPKGRDQCAERQKQFTRHDDIELLVASPLRRALQTCSLTFEPCLKRGLTIVALPMAEEASDAPCDTGSEADVLKAEFPEHVDFDNVKHGWWLHEGEYAFEPKALNARAAKLRRWIKNRPEKEVALVSHGFFNHYLTGDVDENGEQTTPWWAETELRTFTFVEDAPLWEGEDSALIRETEESLKRLGDDREGAVKNVNRPAERRKSLVNYGTNMPLKS